MKRRTRAIRLLLALLALGAGGAVVNVAVAWGCVRQWPASIFRHSHQLFVRCGDRADTRIDSMFGLITFLQSGPAVTPDWTRFERYMIDEARYAAMVPSWSAFHNREPAYDEPLTASKSGWTRMRFAECAAGWPAFALRGTCSWLIDARATTKASKLSGLIDISAQGFSETRFLPLLPIWPGFAINSVFYAALLWLLLAAPFALRRRRRIKRGLCPKCAYPVGTSDVCSECGRVCGTGDSPLAPALPGGETWELICAAFRG